MREYAAGEDPTGGYYEVVYVRVWFVPRRGPATNRQSCWRWRGGGRFDAVRLVVSRQGIKRLLRVLCTGPEHTIAGRWDHIRTRRDLDDHVPWRSTEEALADCSVKTTGIPRPMRRGRSGLVILIGLQSATRELNRSGSGSTPTRGARRPARERRSETT